MIDAPLDRRQIVRIDCEVGRHRATLLRYAADPRARQVLKAWGGPLFRGAAFTVYHLSDSVTTLNYAEIAAMFDLPISKTAARRAAAPNALARPASQARPPRLQAAPPAPTPTHTPRAESRPTARPGLVQVPKTIIHRGREMTVRYWVRVAQAA